MRLGGEPVGRWGLGLLAMTGVAGLLLGWHGWAGRASAAPPSLAGGAATVAPSASVSPATSAPAPATSAPAPSPSPSRTASPGTAKLGPLLKSEPYASVAFQVWPGPISATAQQALTGLTVSVHRQGSALSVAASVAGQPPSPPRLFPGGTRVYVVEAAMGDDSSNSDYNLGDDGLVVTNAQGRIIG